MARSDPSSYILPVGLLIGGYMLYQKFFGARPDPGGNVTPGTGDTRPATLDDATAQTAADAIDVAIWGSGIIEQPWEDEGAVITAMKLAQVTNDVRLIENKYGYRGTDTAQLTHTAPDLAGTIEKYLSDSDKAAINSDYQAKGITIQFA